MFMTQASPKSMTVWPSGVPPKDPRIKIMAGREELSPARAYNCALKQAGGEFIAFMSEADTTCS